ncbi:MAG: ABC transporter transmembrane domain-containing protein, partial [Candidatus Cloacimonetes bacterium]|nr:ABC transporter transmembrane domain-containing protein [Candidatus Cloacimonadota bacterium]
MNEIILRRKIRYINSIDLFQNLSDSDKLVLAKNSSLVEFSIGDRISDYGQTSEKFIFVVRGVLRIKNENDKSISKISRGEYCNEYLFTGSEPNVYSIKVNAPSRLLVINTELPILSNIVAKLGGKADNIYQTVNEDKFANEKPLEPPVDLDKIPSKLQLVVKELVKIPIFRPLNYEDFIILAEKCITKKLQVSTDLIQEGDVASRFFMVVSGTIRLKKKIKGKIVAVQKLKTGDFIGQESFFGPMQWEYTVSCSSNCNVLELDTSADSVKQLSEKLKKNITEHTITEILYKIIGTERVDETWFRKLISDVRLIEMDEDKVVFESDSKSTSLFYIINGIVEIYYQTLKEEILIGNAESEDYFGEIGAYNQKNQIYKAKTIRQSLLLEIPNEHFLRIIRINESLNKLLSDRITEYTNEVRKMEYSADKEYEEDDRINISKEAINGVKKFPWLRQHDETDCGAACLTMLSRFYGLHLSMGKVREMANVTTAGASMTAVCRAAENLGYRARGVKSTIKGLFKINLPCIIHWQGFHYIVCYKIDSRYVYLADPAVGYRKISHTVFLENWTGYAIELEPTEELHKIEPDKKPVWKFLAYLKPFRFFYFEILLGAMILNVLGLASPLFLQSIVDNVVVYKNVSLLNMMLMGMVLIAFFQTFTSAVQQFLAAHITAKIDLRMIAEFYKHVLSMPMDFFYKRKIGDILTRFGENSNIRGILTNVIISTILNLLMFIVYINMMFSYNAKMSLIVLGFCPFFIAQTIVFTPIFKKLNNELFDVNAEQSSLMIESIQGIETIKASNIEWNIRTKWEERYLKMVNKNFHLAKIGLISGVSSQIINTASSIVILWYGANQVINGSMSLGELMAFNSIIGSVMGPLMGFVSLWDQVQSMNVSMDRVNDVLEK